MNLPFPVILASASPRRKQLLADLIETFDVFVSEVDEDAITVPDPFITAETLAEAKATAVFERYSSSLVIGGDTVVACEIGETWQQFAKPSDPDDAVRMLHALSGRTHVVATGLCVLWPNGKVVTHDQTRVTFRTLSEQEVLDYVATGEPMDKAGAYAIQGGAAPFIHSYEGSISNVIGLPMEKLREVLSALAN